MWPRNQLQPLVTIHTLSAECLGNFLEDIDNEQFGSGISSLVFPSANRAIFLPFAVFTNIKPLSMFVINGATAAGNIDVGIYSLGGTKLWSNGGTAQSGTSAIQSFSVTGLELSPGTYYFAVAESSTSATLYRGSTGTLSYDKMTGLAQMATAYPLPASATLATATSDYIPIVGLTTRSVI
jgi:hypothetical protein